MQNIFRSIVPVIWKQNFSGLPLRFISSNSGNNKKTATNAEVVAWVDSLGAADQQKVRYLQNEIALNLLKHNLPFGPENVTVLEYTHLLTLSSNQRQSFYRHLRKQKLTAIRNEEKATTRKKSFALAKEREQLAQEVNDNEPEHIKYELSGYALLPRVLPKTIDRWDNLRAFGAMARNEPKLIVDCGFEHALTTQDILLTSKQIVRSFGENRRHCMPFVMHLCNLQPNGLLRKFLTKELPTFESSYTPLQVHKEDYCDLFPKEQLVLLTPHSPNPLKEYDPNMHYVLGGYVNRRANSPFLMSKAKQLQLQTAHLPLHAFRSLQSNYTKMPLNQIVRVLLEVKYGKSWNEAIEYIAKRFIK